MSGTDADSGAGPAARFAGRFTESGIWHTDAGQRGPLESVVEITLAGDDLRLDYEDGSRHTAVVGLGAFPLTGSGASGTLYLGARTLIVEYTADVGGRTEHNTDIWTFGESGVTRSGVIRQAGRTIWFEADMQREPQSG